MGSWTKDRFLFTCEPRREHTVVLDGNASDSYFTFTQRLSKSMFMCIPGSGFGRSTETFLLFSVIKDNFETGGGEGGVGGI